MIGAILGDIVGSIYVPPFAKVPYAAAISS